MRRRVVGLIGGALLALLSAALPARAQRAATAPIVIVDAGHGGGDAGVDPAGSGLIEKDVVLDIAGRLRAQLEQQGATVLMTRTTDRFVSRAARIQYTNALLFRPDNDDRRGRMLSIHLNSSREAPGLTRVEVLVDPAADGPFTLAGELAARLRATTGGTVGYVDEGYPDGVHPADIAVVRWTYPRGGNVISEAAFLSNPDQAARLHSPSFLDALARAHAQTIAVEHGR